MARGRTKGNPKWAKDWQEQLCLRIESGRSARSVSGDGDMPDWATVKRYLEAEPEFSAQYARACEGRADALVDELLEIADDGSNDWMEKNDPESPGYVANGEHIQRSRVRVDARKWLVGKLAPKKYGDRMAIDATVTGPELSEADMLDRLVAQIPVLNTLLAERGYQVVKLAE